MQLKAYLFGAGLGNVIGGLIGVAVLPLGWFTVLFGTAAIVGAYIAQATWKKYYGTAQRRP